MAIINSAVTIRSQSTLAASSRMVYGGTVTIKGKSNFIYFYLKMSGKSGVTIGNIVTAKSSSARMGGQSTLSASLVKVGKPFVEVTTLEGEVIYTLALEGGGVSYMKTNQDFNLVSGDYRELDITIYDEQGNKKDISGSNFHWVMGSVSKSNGNGITITDAVNGGITIVLQPEDTLGLLGGYPHQARMTDAQNHPTTIFKGTAIIEKGIA